MKIRIYWPLALAALGLAPMIGSASCGGEFTAWLREIRAEAVARGVSEQTLAQLDRVRPNPKVLARDRAQGVFAQDWLTFAGRMANDYRLRLGRERLTRWRSVFERAERDTGVPGAVIAAFWGLETDYGQVQGDFDTLTALATLAHDCRRPELFRPQLLATLQLLDRPDLAPARWRGAWAGEIGQIQILPSDYLRFGTDGDGDGRVDLVASEPDTVATAAQLLAERGWRRGEPWLEEVRLPDELPWADLDPERPVPRAQWRDWGVRSAATGGDETWPDLPAALLLPMGRHGPAFLSYPNFAVFTEWNRSLVYATTAAYFATRLAGAPPVAAGHPEPGLKPDEVRLLQTKLEARGHDVGGIDGMLGGKTRAAVRAEQRRLGWPADGWPTPALLQRL